MEVGEDKAGLIWLRIAKDQYKHSWEAIATSLKAQTRRSPGVLYQKDSLLRHWPYRRGWMEAAEAEYSLGEMRAEHRSGTQQHTNSHETSRLWPGEISGSMQNRSL